MAQKKVLHLVEYLLQGGIERLLVEIARSASDDSESRALHGFFAYEMDDYSGAAKQIKEMGKDIHIYKKAPGHDGALFRKLKRLVSLDNISVIHTHDFGPMEYAIRLKMAFPRISLIHTQHTIHHFIPNLKYMLFFQFARPFYKHIVTVSNHVRKEINKKSLFKSSATIVVNNGVDYEHFSRLKRPRQDANKLKLVCVSRISTEKNLPYILKTCARLKREGIDFHLDHAGGGSQKDVDRTFSYIQRSGLKANVTLHGHQVDVRDVLKKGDFFISSSHTEGHPLSVLEAMASGRLCLCSDIAPHRELSQNGIVLFDKEKDDSLFNLLKDIRLNLHDYAGTRDIAQQDVREKFTLNNMTEKYERLYANCPYLG